MIAGRVEGQIAGAAPLATLVPIRAVHSVVQVLDGDVARAVDVARARGCHVISMSLGGRGFVGLRDAIRAAVADGIIVMAAAGNKVGIVVAPASYPECIAVAAELEKELGKPVIAVNAAIWWMALRDNGIDDKIDGCGRLLREF